MASTPDSHPDSAQGGATDAPEQIIPDGNDGRESVEEPSPADDSGFSRDDGSDALA